MNRLIDADALKQYALICCSRTNILYQHSPIPADIAQKLGIEPKE